jgi:uncharacterized protein YbjT (DUF2867 family)
MILVTAGYGHQSRLLIPKLVAAGQKVRAVRRKRGGEADLERLGAHEVFIGDLSDENTCMQATRGIEAVFHVGPATHPAEREMGFIMIKAAQAVGVRHFIFSSVQHTIINILQHRLKRDVEERLIESGLNFTIIKSCSFMMDEMYFTPVVQHGEFQVYWKNKPGRRVTLIDIPDLTDAIAKVINEGARHYFASYELAGPDKLTIEDMARIASNIMQRDIRTSQKEAKDLLRIISGTEEVTPANQHAYDIMISGGSWHSQFDFVGNPLVLEWLLGRPATTFEQYFQRTWENFSRA